MDNTYLWFKAIHVLGVVIFLGNLVVTAWWKSMADLTRDAKVIAYAQRQVLLTDLFFTAGGAALLLIGGIGAAITGHLDMAHTRWLNWGGILFVLSGLIWLLVLIPVEVMQSRLVKGVAAGGAIPARYWMLNRIWTVFGVLATVLPLAAIYWMVVKPS